MSQIHPICRFCQHRKRDWPQDIDDCRLDNVRTNFSDTCSHFLFDQKAHDTFHLQRIRKKNKRFEGPTVRPLKRKPGSWLEKYMPLEDGVSVYDYKPSNPFIAVVVIVGYLSLMPLIFLLDGKTKATSHIFIISSIFLAIAVIALYQYFKIKKEIKNATPAFVIRKSGIQINRRKYPWSNTSLIIEETFGKNRYVDLHICTLGFHEETIPLLGLSIGDQKIEMLILLFQEFQSSTPINPSIKRHVFYN